MDCQGFDIGDLVVSLFIYLIVGVRSVNYDTNIFMVIQLVGDKNKALAVLCNIVCLLFWPFKETLKKFLHRIAKKIDEHTSRLRKDQE